MMAIGGLAYAPSDFSRMADYVEGTLHVIDQPIHVGSVKRMEGWQRWLRTEYARIFRTLGAEYLIGHSCGSFDGAHIANNLPSLKGLVMLTPPYGKAGMSDRSRCEDFGLLDRCLASLCDDMPDDLYRSMLAEHDDEYGLRIKDIYRHEIPKGESVVRDVIQLMRESRSPILVLLGSQDPWNNGAEPPAEGEHISVQRMTSGHYPHVTQPEATTQYVHNWLRSHTTP